MRAPLASTVLLLLLLLCGPTALAADAEAGRALAAQHCTRCHVVADINPHGGINSTPSFRLLANFPDWDERFRTFYARRPHPVFVRVPDVPPPPSETPPHVAVFKVTAEDIEDLLAFVEGLRE